MYCSSLSNLANKLLQSPMFPSGFGLIVMFGSKGVETMFILPRPFFHKTDSIYCFEEIAIDLGVHVISILMILDGSPRSVICHSLSTLEMAFPFSSTVVANMRRSSTHTVMIMKSSLVRQM